MRTERFHEFFEATIADVHGYVAARVDAGHVDDVVANVYIAAVPAFDRGEDLTIAWLMVVARRRVVDHWRSQGRIRARMERLRLRRDEPAPDIGTAAAERDRVELALAQLSPEHRSVLLMRYLDGFTVREVAELLGRSEKAVESLSSRARQAFRDAYGEST